MFLLPCKCMHQCVLPSLILFFRWQVLNNSMKKEISTKQRKGQIVLPIHSKPVGVNQKVKRVIARFLSESMQSMDRVWGICLAWLDCSVASFVGRLRTLPTFLGVLFLLFQWDRFFEEFNFQAAQSRNVCLMVEKFLLHLLLCEKGRFLWLQGVCAILWSLWFKRNNRVLSF